MQPIQFFAARAEDGALLPSAMVNVLIHGTQERALLFANSAVTVPLENPLQADANGRVFFYTTAPRIDIYISRYGYVAPPILDISTLDAATAVELVQGKIDEALAKIDGALFEMEREFKQLYDRLGYEPIHLIYATGVKVDRATQLIERDGELYKVKLKSDLPLVLSGSWVADQPKLVAVGDNALRQYLGGAGGSGGIGFDLKETYAPGTAGFELAQLVMPGAKKQQRTFADFMMQSNLGNLDQLNKALMSGACTVVFAGDSIAEGDRDGMVENSFVQRVMRVLREQNPSIKFKFANFSLAGRGIAHLANVSYLGMDFPEDPYVGFWRAPGNDLTAGWPGGSVKGKAWINHIRDFSPDLVIALVGANDTSDDGNTNASQVIALLRLMADWAKPPSVALAPVALPASTYGYQHAIQTSANVMRGLARARGVTLLDINRLFHLQRYGKDVDDCAYVRNNGFSGYPSGWTVAAGSTLAPSGLPAGYALQGSGSAMRNVVSQDIHQVARFTMPNWSTQTGQIFYRSLGTPVARYSAQVTGNAVQLYFGGTQLASYAISPAVPNGTEVSLRVDVRGCRHRVFLNGLTVIDVNDYGNPMPGTHGVGIVGGLGTVYGFEASLGNPKQVGVPELSDQDIYGYSEEEFANNPNSSGGNGKNHPTELGHKIIWAASFAPLVNHIRATSSIKVVDFIAPIATTDNGAFAVAATYVATEIDGTKGYATGVLVTPTGSSAASNFARIVTVTPIEGREIVVRVVHSTGPFYLTTKVGLPRGGWLVKAEAIFSKDSGGVVVNTMLVTAVRVG